MSQALIKFKNRKTAYYSSIILTFWILFSLTADLVINNKPYYLSFKKEKNFFPLFVNYTAEDFGEADIEPNYKSICVKKDIICYWPLVRFSPLEIDSSISSYPSAPSWSHPMGLDSIGRDIFARMVYGFRVSFSYALMVWILAFALGTMMGALMGYFGGWVDIILYRFMEIFFSIPYLIVLITLVSVFAPNIYLLALITSFFHWGNVARYTRAEFLKLRNFAFVYSAQVSGCSTLQILVKHILPNALTPLITLSPFFIASSILGLSSLDFLGLGVPPPTPSWGELLKQGKEYFMMAWYLAFFPALGLFCTLAMINFIGEGIRDAFDPKKY